MTDQKPGRGGARPGAGRPKAIEDSLQRLAIGARCERLWEDAWAQNLERAKAETFSVGDYDALIAAVRTIPVPDRAAWLASDKFEVHAADVEEERRALAAMPDADDSPAPRLLRITAKRPKGVKPRIIAAVADWASEQAGQNISPRQVRECWTEFRNMMR